MPGSESEASMSFSTFDDRTGNLYAVTEGGGPDNEDVVIRWKPAPDLSSMSREEEMITNKIALGHTYGFSYGSVEIRSILECNFYIDFDT